MASLFDLALIATSRAWGRFESCPTTNPRQATHLPHVAQTASIPQSCDQGLRLPPLCVLCSLLFHLSSDGVIHCRFTSV